MQRKQFFKGKYKGKIKSSQKRPTIPWTPRECGTGKTNRSKQSQDNKINEVKLNAKQNKQTKFIFEKILMYVVIYSKQ